MEPGAGTVWPLLLVLVSYALEALAYIPAHATNDTIGFSDTSSLVLQWYPGSSYSETVSYQLVGADSTGISQGVLVHFSEQGLIPETTRTPWIALISCDANATDSSTQDDVFTLARDRGAVSAVLYSNTSESCIVNPEYADPQLFDNVMDIFVIPSLALSRIVEDRFQQEDPSGTYSSFNPSALSASAAVVFNAIVNHAVSAPGLLFATLTAANATRPASSPTVPAPSATQTASISTSMVKLAPWIIVVIAISGTIVLGCLGLGAWKWYRQNWARPRRVRRGTDGAADDAAEEGTATVTAPPAPDVEVRELRSGPVAASSRRRSESRSGEDRPPRRVTFSPERLVRPLGDRPEFVLLDSIEEVPREPVAGPSTSSR